MKQILIVDDNLALRQGLLFLLELHSNSWQVTEIGNHEEAKERLATGPAPGFDLIVLDMRMPDNLGNMNHDAGLLLLEYLARQQIPTPVFVLTVRDDLELQRKLKEYSIVKDFMVKEPDPDRFITIVKKHLDSAPLNQQDGA